MKVGFSLFIWLLKLRHWSSALDWNLYHVPSCSQALDSGWNDTTNLAGSPACRWQTVGLLSSLATAIGLGVGTWPALGQSEPASSSAQDYCRNKEETVLSGIANVVSRSLGLLGHHCHTRGEAAWEWLWHMEEEARGRANSWHHLSTWIQVCP